VGDVGDPDLHHQFLIPGDEPAVLDGVDLPHLVDDVVGLHVVTLEQSDQRTRPQSDVLGRDNRSVPEQHAAFLQPANPFLHARAGQAHLAAELGPTGPAVQPKCLDQLPIDRVHVRRTSRSPQIRR